MSDALFKVFTNLWFIIVNDDLNVEITFSRFYLITKSGLF